MENCNANYLHTLYTSIFQKFFNFNLFQFISIFWIKIFFICKTLLEQYLRVVNRYIPSQKWYSQNILNTSRDKNLNKIDHSEGAENIDFTYE